MWKIKFRTPEESDYWWWRGFRRGLFLGGLYGGVMVVIGGVMLLDKGLIVVGALSKWFHQS